MKFLKVSFGDSPCFAAHIKLKFDYSWVCQLWWLLSVNASAQRFIEYVYWAHPLEVN